MNDNNYNQSDLRRNESCENNGLAVLAYSPDLLQFALNIRIQNMHWIEEEKQQQQKLKTGFLQMPPKLVLYFFSILRKPNSRFIKSVKTNIELGNTGMYLLYLIISKIRKIIELTKLKGT